MHLAPESEGAGAGGLPRKSRGLEGLVSQIFRCDYSDVISSFVPCFLWELACDLFGR